MRKDWAGGTFILLVIISAVLSAFLSMYALDHPDSAIGKPIISCAELLLNENNPSSAILGVVLFFLLWIPGFKDSFIGTVCMVSFFLLLIVAGLIYLFILKPLNVKEK